MTEKEWLTCADPTPMLAFIKGNGSERKLRLYACACCRSAWDGTETAKSRRSVEVAERYADGQVTGEQLARAWSAGRKPVEWLAAHSVHKDLDAVVIGYNAKTALNISSVSSMLLRCVYGNPFRPVAVAPEWLTSTVTALATGIYADRAFDRLPILADALQDAGCESEEVLSHCRGPGPHVRGCWVIDLLLGKE
jgi:hypothetical protein